MTITQVITALPTAPNPATDTPDTFSTKASAMVLAQVSAVTEYNTLATQINATVAGMNSIATGTAVAIPYTFSTTTIDSDPGTGYLRLDNATQNLATTIRADLSSSAGTDWTSALNTLADSTSVVKGHIRLVHQTDGTKWILFSISALASPAGYKNITVTPIASSAASPFANLDSIVFQFARTGDKGSIGPAFIPLGSIKSPNVINDALSAPPGTTVVGEVYLINNAAPTGAWTGLAGHAVYALDTTGTTFTDLGLVAIGSRFGLAMEHGTVAGGFTGKSKQIAQVTNATPGSFAYTFEVPTDGNFVVVNAGTGLPDDGHGYGYTSVTASWYEIFLPTSGISQAQADARYPIYVGAAGGTADALTATVTTPITALYDGMEVGLRVSTSNATTTPTFNLTLGATATGVKNITSKNGYAVAMGEVSGWVKLAYSVSSGTWLLLNASGAKAPYADATGTADAITASYSVDSAVLYDGYELALGIVTVNATTTPTFAPTLNGAAQTARTIWKHVGNVAVALNPGDLQGVAELRYDLPNTRWILQNPATVRGVIPASFKNLNINAIGINNYNCVITASKVVLENSSGIYWDVENVNLTVNANGAVGAPLSIMSARAASTWYYRWLWYNATNGVTATLDVSSTAPTAPTGYASTDYKALLPGACRTDASGSTYLLQISTNGRSSRYVVLAGSNTPSIPIASSGVQGSVTVPTWIAVAVSSFVPVPTASAIFVAAQSNGGSGIIVAPNNSYGAYNSANTPPLVAYGSEAVCIPGMIQLESTNIYTGGAISTQMNVLGWEDNI